MPVVHIIPIITPEQEELILENSLKTYEDKLILLNKAYSKHIMPTTKFKFSDDENIGNFIEAVMRENWEVDSGKRYINITETVGIANFLYCKRNESGELEIEDKETDWDAISFDRATLFTIDEINTKVPECYRHPSMILTEHEAEVRWSKSSKNDNSFDLDIPRTIDSDTSARVEVGNVDDEKKDYVKESINIIQETEKKLAAPHDTESTVNTGKEEKRIKASLRPR